MNQRKKRHDLLLKLVKHFLGSPGSTWSAQELQIIFGASQAATYSALRKLRNEMIIVVVGGGHTLNPSIISELRGNITQLRRVKERLDARQQPRTNNSPNETD
jgi:hypothetical protein